MWRATIRFSLDKDSSSVTRNSIAQTIKSAGFSNVKTGTWEAYSQNHKAIADATSQALQIAEQSGKLDHYWIHIEKLSLRQQTRLMAAAKAITPK